MINRLIKNKIVILISIIAISGVLIVSFILNNGKASNENIEEQKEINNIILENKDKNNEIENKTEDIENKIEQIESVIVNDTIQKNEEEEKTESNKSANNKKKSSNSSENKSVSDKRNIEKEETPKSIKVPVDKDSYVELEAGYAYGTQTVELPAEWNY